ncbi:MAG TPA: MFS transporter, partial [Micromonosporaceae bacterium]|nr:MFS transporter [Micromonosporaceae bacterium]
MTVAAAPAAPDQTVARRVLISLCVTEITSWGVLYYAFPVLTGDITAATGWPVTAVTAAFSLGQITAAVVGIAVGRVLDRRGPCAVMTTGSVLATTALVLIATAPTLAAFTVGWMLAGAAMGGVLYPPAFAALTRWYGPGRVRALTTLTLVAGLASTVFAPTTALLAAHLDWRQTYLVLAGILAVITIPGHAWGLRGPWPAHPHQSRKVGGAGAIRRSRAFLALALAATMTGFAAYAVVITLVPLLTERGLSTTTAAVVLGLGGAGQVLGRLGYPALARRTSVRTRTVLIVAATAATIALLGLLTTLAALVVAAVLAGTTRGLFTLLQATAITDRWGTVHYGQLTAVLSAPVTLAAALAP